MLPHLHCWFSNHEGVLNLLQYREEIFKVLRESRSQIITVGKGWTIPWWGNQNKSINCYFYFSQFGDKRYQNFKNYQCTSTLGGVSKEKEFSSVCYYQSCSFEMLLRFCHFQTSQSCVLAWLSEWYRSRAKCHATVLNLVIPKHNCVDEVTNIMMCFVIL